MRNLFVLLCCVLWVIPSSAQKPLTLGYYLADSIKYDPAIPVPEAVIGHQVGEWHVTHDKLVLYMKTLAQANPRRIKLQVTGTTYEGREQLLLIITSPNNHGRLEEIRKEHIALTDANAPEPNTANMPAVLWMGYSIHGNESSGSNASLLAAYHLAAAQGPQIDNLLQNTVILLDPSFNPDGLNRFANWANQHKSKNLVADPNSREYNEVWPGGRFNHYWFDLNRDWLPAVHRESQNRLQWFHAWKPNVLTDHHEMGSNATFFFQPGVPSRVHPLTPKRNQELTEKIGRYHAAYLDRIGSQYFTKEGYDDFYYGKGSTFPDMQGGIGILFEQASSRGHVQETDNGLLTFPFTIRNQFVTTLSTMQATLEMRRELLDYQRSFYKQMAQDAASSAEKAFVFGDETDPYRAQTLANMLTRHQVTVHTLARNVQAGGQQFEAGKAFVVPTHQKQYKLIRAVFDKQLKFTDSLFYDVTSWTMPLAFGLNYAALDAAAYNSALLGNAVTGAGKAQPPAGQVATGNAGYGYLLGWQAFEAPAATYWLQQKGVLLKAATVPFSIQVAGKEQAFAAGTIILMKQGQTLGSAEIDALVKECAAGYGVQFYPLATGNSITGSDLGSRYMQKLEQPKIAMLVGNGVNATDAGEVWHLLDQRMNIPASHLEIGTFNRADLSRYNTLIMVGGSYGGLSKEKLREWVQSGGVLIACEDALNWCADNGIAKLEFKKTANPYDSLRNPRYADKEQIDGAQRMNGAIFRANIDNTHPLCFGYAQPYIDMFKTNNVFVQVPKNPFASPVKYGTAPLQSGYITQQNYAALKNSVSVVVQTLGSGRLVLMADNPNFRAFWLGGTRLFMNGIFFGRLVNAGSARAEE